LVPKPGDREQDLVDDHRHEHDALVVGLQEGVERVAATIEDEVPLVEVEADPAPEVHDQGEGDGGDRRHDDGGRTWVAQGATERPG
jgi:hypothetical protein